MARSIKEVKKYLRKEVKKEFLLNIIESIKNGDNPTTISKKLNIKKQTLNYHIHKLKEKGIIKKVGYGVWEVKDLSKVTTTLKPKEVRGHAFMWKVRIPRSLLNWSKRIEILKKNGFDVKEVGVKKIPRIMIDNRKVWLGNKYIIIYEPESFFGETAYESRKLAIFKLKNVLEKLESKLKINLKENNKYYFKVRRSHYSLIKNNLAIQCNKDNEKIYVYDSEGLWFCIDNSYNLDEAETMNKNSFTNNLGVQEYFNSHKRTDFKVTPEFVLNGFSQLMQINNKLEQNIKSHLALIQEYRKENIKWRKATVKDIEKNKFQKTLLEF